MDTIDMLSLFGLTRQEALIYQALHAEGSLTGYETAKITGISRSNTYNSLAALVEKGGAYVEEGPVSRYTPVPVGEFCNNKIRRLSKAMEQLVCQMPAQKDEIEGYITIKGERNILDKLSSMIAEARERVYLAVPDQILERILPDLNEAISRGMKVVLITSGSVAPECATVYRADRPGRQIRLIADSTNVLTGDIDNGEYSTCLYSKKKNLIDLFKEAMKNEIRLIELTKGGQCE